MTKIAYVRVALDDDIPEYMSGIIRCGSVISEDENGGIIQDHQNLIDNTEFRSEQELIASVAIRLKVSESVVEITE